MRQRLLAVALFAALAPAAESPRAVSRNWTAAPAIVQVDTTADIFAMGDVHGDYDRLVALLAGSGVLAGVPAAPDRPQWAAGRAVLVFTGDLIDKGPNALAVIALLRALPGAAAAAGGRVIVLMGNHEAEFLASPEGKDRDFPVELSRAGRNSREVAACQDDIGRFLCALPFAARVNDWFFSHAGNTSGRTLADLAADLRADVDRHGFGATQLSAPNSLLEARIAGKKTSGGAWYDADAAHIPVERLLAGYAAAVQARHIVQGHQHGNARFPDGALRQAGEMYQWRGLLFLIDTGLSRDINDSAGAILHIRPGSQAAAICADGAQTVIWHATRPDQTGKAPPCRVREPNASAPNRP